MLRYSVVCKDDIISDIQSGE